MGNAKVLPTVEDLESAGGLAMRTEPQPGLNNDNEGFRYYTLFQREDGQMVWAIMSMDDCDGELYRWKDPAQSSFYDELTMLLLKDFYRQPRDGQTMDILIRPCQDYVDKLTIQECLYVIEPQKRNYDGTVENGPQPR